jgi:hypothetical protein
MERLPEPQQALVLEPFRKALTTTPLANLDLLAPLQLHVHDLMDHQFVTLVVTDDKKTPSVIISMEQEEEKTHGQRTQCL